MSGKPKPCDEKSEQDNALKKDGGNNTTDSINLLSTSNKNPSLKTQEVITTLTENNEISSASEEFTVDVGVVQSSENKTLAENSLDNEKLPVETPIVLHHKQRTNTSFVIPDGLVMDPMAPTALAVSSEFMDRIGSGLMFLRDHGKKIQKLFLKNKKFELWKKPWRYIVNVVLIEAKDLPDGPATGPDNIYCKFRLGSEYHKSKLVPKAKASWCERFNLYVADENSLDVSVWHKGKQKNFMGRCTIDISKLEREKTHDIWEELECGYGSVHLLITLSGSLSSMPVDSVPTTNGVSHVEPETDEYSWYRLDNDWSEVGQLSVTVHGARGLCALGISGKVDAYCVLELDNSRVQTHVVSGSANPNWNKSFNFAVNDITSTLDITVYDQSFINEVIGNISIPLLRINNNEKRWYALKDRSKKYSARGHSPRILLQMSVAWNPIKASLRVLSPKENKYIQKPPKFDIPLIYSNIVFIRDIFDAIRMGNEFYKNLFEWENREKSAVALITWLAFWYFFQLWMLPLVLLLPFLFNWTEYRSCNYTAIESIQTIDDIDDEDSLASKDDKTIISRLSSLQDLTLTIKNYIDYLVSLIERVHNLANFTMPYLSYLAMIVLVGSAAVLYLVPINYLFMVLGIYKFTRKFLNPERVPNNDLLDFLSRVPDNEILKQWRELKVPEPNLSRNSSLRRHN